MEMKNDYDDDHLFLLCTMRAVVEIRYPFESIYFV
jgi:hypothetical protein